MGGSCSRLPADQIHQPQPYKAADVKTKKSCPADGPGPIPPEETQQERGAEGTAAGLSIHTRRTFRPKTTNKIGRKGALTLLRPSSLWAAGEATVLEVEVRVPVMTPFKAGSRVVLADNGYWRQASVPLPEGLKAGDVVTVELPAKPKRARMTLRDVKEEVELRVGGAEEMIQRQLLMFNAVDFAGDLIPKLSTPSPSPLQLLVIGGDKAGKSTFIQTLVSVLNSAETDSTPPPDASSLQPTTTLTRTDLGNTNTSRFHTPLQACAVEFPSTDALFGMEEEELKVAFGTAHAVLFFIAAHEIESSSKKTEDLQRLFLLLRSLSLSPLIVLTHMDKVEPLIALDPSNWTLDKVARLRRRVCKLFDVTWAQTFVFVPYSAPKPVVTATTTAKASMRTDVMLRGESGGHFPDLREEGGGEGGGGEGGGGGRSFDIDRSVLFIAKAAFDAAKGKVEANTCISSSSSSSSTTNSSSISGGSSSSSSSSSSKVVAATPAMGRVAEKTTTTPLVTVVKNSPVARQETVELDDSFSSNFQPLTFYRR
ncbi:Hypothetical protein NocV09_01300240 [Nannochloropsis oceanica]